MAISTQLRKDPTTAKTLTFMKPEARRGELMKYLRRELMRELDLPSFEEWKKANIQPGLFTNSCKASPAHPCCVAAGFWVSVPRESPVGSSGGLIRHVGAIPLYFRRDASSFHYLDEPFGIAVPVVGAKLQECYARSLRHAHVDCDSHLCSYHALGPIVWFHILRRFPANKTRVVAAASTVAGRHVRRAGARA